MNTKLIVIDTNVCLDLFVFHEKKTDWLMQELKEHQLQAITSRTCRDEYLRVLEYDKLSLDKQKIDLAISQYDQYLSLITDTTIANANLPICRDPDDQKFMELAKQFHANYVFTKDKHLLHLNNICKKRCNFEIKKPLEQKNIKNDKR